ncbi:MAG: beta-ketoacyl-[acyl-carrier-protein] synthase II [Caldilineae bacterium]|nr:MAG: beta-ketoacyl-[acyl-carrier-protein] synthase II [Caldilineae bacterium]
MTANNNRRRVVITGVGAVSPVGLDVQTTWEAMLAARSGAEKVTDDEQLPTRIACPIRDFDPTRYMSRKEARRVGRVTQLALAATEEAIAHARLDLSKEDPTRVGIDIGTAFGALDVLEEQAWRIRGKGPKAVNPVIAPAVLATTTPCHLGIHYGLKGPANSPVVACATGVYSLGEAARRIQRGEVDVELAGGTDSYITELILYAFSKLGAMTTRNDDPKHACRPFDKERDGMIMGEGAVTMVMESLEHALARGATILAEFGGMGFSSDGYNMAAPDPDGTGAARAMKLALTDAGLEPQAIDYVAAHGTATRLNDLSETRAVKHTLGEHAYNVAVSSVKPLIGHAMGAAGAFGALTVVMAIQTGWIPPTANYSVPDPDCDLDYVPNEARQMEVNAGIANAFGFGGQNCSVVIKRYQE